MNQYTSDQIPKTSSPAPYQLRNGNRLFEYDYSGEKIFETSELGYIFHVSVNTETGTIVIDHAQSFLRYSGKTIST